VVALGEERDGADVTLLQSRRKIFFRKATSDALDAFRGVEIKMYLSVWKL
jgi:hypothetical protein